MSGIRINHADATEARVTLNHLGDEVDVTVDDNGIGIEAGGRRNGSGYGLAGIQEQARRLGGSCSIESRSSQGTILKIRLVLSESSCRKVKVASMGVFILRHQDGPTNSRDRR